jgi:hypothetical protein
LNAVLGWVDSGEKFNGRKFGASVLRGVITALGVVVAFPAAFPSTAPIGLLQYVLALLAGAGVDTLGHTVSSVTGVKDKLAGTPQQS